MRSFWAEKALPAFCLAGALLYIAYALAGLI